jgi:hypothetical protein
MPNKIPPDGCGDMDTKVVSRNRTNHLVFTTWYPSRNATHYAAMECKILGISLIPAHGMHYPFSVRKPQNTTEAKMRTMFTIAISACLLACAFTGSVDGVRAGCLDRIERSVRLGDTITVIKVDSTVIRGTFPTVMTAASALCIRSVSTLGENRIMIQAIDIDRVTYRKQTHVFGIVGFIVGMAGGAAAGAALAPAPHGFMDMPEVGTGLIGALIGGLVGGGAGGLIDQKLTRAVTVDCR